MNIELFANSLEIGSVDAKIIDASMGVIGGELNASVIYFEQFQLLFRQHSQYPDWIVYRALNLRATSQLFGELKAEGGICITDVAGFDKVSVEVCGLDSQTISKFLSLEK